MNAAPDIIGKFLRPESRFKLTPFGALTPGAERAYLVRGLIPRVGLTVVWGPPKCGKSFWIFDVAMHVALDWEYRNRRVHKGPVVYCAFEGADGYKARAEAFRQGRLPEDHDPNIDFHLIGARANLIADHAELIAAIRSELSDLPVLIVLDTLNRSLQGSESNDQDMANYVKATDAIREAFNCAVVIVHHCGIEGTRPRGHTSLTGAADAQLAVKRDANNNVIVEVEWMKDGPEGDRLVSRLKSIDVGENEDGEAITSCIVEAVQPDETMAVLAKPKQLTPNQEAALNLLQEAGGQNIDVDTWNRLLRGEGIGVKRRADLCNIRSSLRNKGLVREYAGKWSIAQ